MYFLSPIYGLSDFTVIQKVYLSSRTTANYFIIGASTGGFMFFVNSSGQLVVRNRGYTDLTPSTDIVPINQWVTVIYKRTSNVGTYYINGNVDSGGGITDDNNYTYPSAYIMYADAAHDNFRCSLFRIFNYSISTIQAANYSKPDYPIEVIDRGATGANLITPTANSDFSDANNWANSSYNAFNSTGDLTVSGTDGQYCRLPVINAPTIPGKYYRYSFDASNIASTTRILSYAGYYLHNNSSTLNISTPDENKSFTGLAVDVGGLMVYSIGSTNINLDNISIVQLGCVLDLNPSGMGKSDATTYNAGQWVDLTNSLTETISGATFVIPPASDLGATYFNGTNSSIAFSGMNGLTGDLSISGWVYPLSWGGYLFCNEHIYISVNGTASSIRFSKDGNGTSLYGAAMSLNTWTHFCVLIPSSGNATLFINTSPATGDAGTATSGVNWILGNTTSTTNGAISNLKDLRVYNRILTQDDITNLYNGVK
jgi:hypothetical protein